VVHIHTMVQPLFAALLLLSVTVIVCCLYPAFWPGQASDACTIQGVQALGTCCSVLTAWAMPAAIIRQQVMLWDHGSTNSHCCCGGLW
jgi:hypothetical protein